MGPEVNAARPDREHENGAAKEDRMPGPSRADHQRESGHDRRPRSRMAARKRGAERGTKRLKERPRLVEHEPGAGGQRSSAGDGKAKENRSRHGAEGHKQCEDRGSGQHAKRSCGLRQPEHGMIEVTAQLGDGERADLVSPGRRVGEDNEERERQEDESCANRDRPRYMRFKRLRAQSGQASPSRP